MRNGFSRGVGGRNLAVAAAVGLSGVLAVPAEATVIFEQFPVTFNNPGAVTSFESGRQVFANFRPATDVAVRSIKWVADNYTADDSVEISIFSSPNPFAGPAGPALFTKVTVADTSEPQPFDFGGPRPVFLETILGEDLGVDVKLLGGVNYQLSIRSLDTRFYAWKAASSFCCAISRDTSTGKDELFGILPAFGLYAAAESVVPEPATWAMMIAGFGLVGGALRRNRANLSRCPA